MVTMLLRHRPQQADVRRTLNDDPLITVYAEKHPHEVAVFHLTLKHVQLHRGTEIVNHLYAELNYRSMNGVQSEFVILRLFATQRKRDFITPVLAYESSGCSE